MSGFRSRFWMPVLVFLLFVLPAVNAATVASPNNFHGQEIQKIIDYLRSLGLNASADNVELYLNSSKIIVDSLDDGALGANDKKGGPVYVDPNNFNNPRLPWNASKPADLDAMMSLATTLIHEKYHSENHSAFDRIAGNGLHKLGGGNSMEEEAWVHALNFLDEIINVTLQKANATGVTKEEKERLLRLARLLVANKLSRVTDYGSNGYGKTHWNETELDGLKRGLDGIVEQIENQSEQEAALKVGGLIKAHDEFEQAVQKSAQVFFKELPEKKALASARYGQSLFYALLAAGISQDNPTTARVAIAFDVPNEFYSSNAELALDYPGRGAPVVLRDPNSGEKFSFLMKIAQSGVVKILGSETPSQVAAQLLASGAASVYEGGERATPSAQPLSTTQPAPTASPAPTAIAQNEPIGRQFEETCGNGVLERGEQCDYGYSCPERMACSVTCICVYPVENPSGDLRPLPPREPIEPDSDGTYYGLREAYDANAAKIPMQLGELFANERIVITVIAKGGNAYNYKAILSGGKMQEFGKGEPANPTMFASLEEKTIDFVRNAPDPGLAVAAAFYQNKLVVKALDAANDWKVQAARQATAVYISLNKNKLSVRAGDVLVVVLFGKEGRLYGIGSGLSVFIVRDYVTPSQPVYQELGGRIGYTNEFTRTIRMANPVSYSANAGIYLQPQTHYESYWQARATPPGRPPAHGTAYSPRTVMQSSYSAGAGYFTAIGGFARR